LSEWIFLRQLFAAKCVKTDRYLIPGLKTRMKVQIMKSAFQIGAAATIALTALIPPVVTEAAPKRVKGYYCESPLPSGTWVGYFSGVRPDPIISFGDDRYIPVSRRACFSTKADCVAWKYWMQTDYPQQVRAAWCRRK
jgi:hypothetical protein